MMTEPREAKAPCILLVDDQESNRKVFRSILELGGYQVVEAPGAKEASEAFDKRAVDLVLTDYDMPPGSNGAKLAMAIREKSPATPVVLVSGDPPRDLPPGLFAAVLTKPPAIGDLLKAVNALTKEGNRDR